MRIGWGVVAVSLVVLAACGNHEAATVGSVRTSTVAPFPDAVFVAYHANGAGDTGGGHGTSISLFDAGSGRYLRDLAHIEAGATVRFGGFSRAADGSVIYAVDRGPRARSDTAGGNPAPDGCGGSVYQVDAGTGVTRSLFTVGRDRTVESPVVSPDGKSVAYLSQACTAGYAQQVVVRTLASGAERRVWVPATSATSVGWRGDGARLVFTVTYPGGGAGPDSRGYVVVAAGAKGALPDSAVRHAPDAGCGVVAAVFAPGGMQVVEGCPDTATTPARLVRLDGEGSGVLWRADTGLCPNGLTARHDPAGRLLLTSTTTCGGSTAPVDVVQLWTERQPHQVGRYVNPRELVSAAA